jgi:hypothetical protein
VGWPTLMHTISEASKVWKVDFQLHILVPASPG